MMRAVNKIAHHQAVPVFTAGRQAYTVQAVNAAKATGPIVLFGPREIYDAAYKSEKVISIPFEEILGLPASLTTDENATVPRSTSDDLLIISKIMRRSPKLAPHLQRERIEMSRRLCYKAAQMGNINASLFWCEETLRTTTTSDQEKREAMRLLTDMAEQKIGKAHYLIANELYSLDRRKDAMRAYRLAGENGVPEAYTKLGRILQQQGFQKQSKLAFKKGAEAGEPNSFFMMSTFAKDEAEKIHYLQKSASCGKVEAAHNLGEYYRRKGELPLALEYLEMAAQQGFQISQINLATLLKDQKRFSDASKWYAQAKLAGGEVGQHAEQLLMEMKNSPEFAAKQDSGCHLM